MDFHKGKSIVYNLINLITRSPRPQGQAYCFSYEGFCFEKALVGVAATNGKQAFCQTQLFITDCLIDQFFTIQQESFNVLF